MTVNTKRIRQHALVALLAAFALPVALLGLPASAAASSESGYGAVAWGQNSMRQLGDGGAEASSTVPRPVSGLTSVTAIAAGGKHSLALLASGKVMAWGSNASGQLGDNSELTPSTPVMVTGLEGVQAVAAGAEHSLALLANGTVMAWGAGEQGQLGNGATGDSSVPVPVKGLSGVRAIAAGGGNSYALLSNGTVMAWGDNEEGQLGDGSSKLLSSVPVAVKGLGNVKALAVGGDFALALLNSGSVEGWGSDAYGQLANSEVEELETNVPVPVNGVSGASALAAGATHALAVLGDGTVLAWGQDSDGELGNGTFQAKSETPMSVSGLSGVSAITAGTQDSAALLADGTVMTWGANNTGQLGNGTAGSPSATPLAIEGVREVAGVAAGAQHMVAFGEPIPVVSSLSPSSGLAAGGNTVTISGQNFEAPVTVRFGSAEATNVTVSSRTSITATAPPGSGAVAVSVTSPAGTSPPVSGDVYTYAPPPQITKLSPKTGSVEGGTSVTITGSNFLNVTEVRFGSLPATYTVNSPTSITAVAPAAPAGAVQLSVTSTSGTSAASTRDVYKFAPVISSLTPSSGPAAGGTRVTVKGAGFKPGTGATKFKFGTAGAKAVSCASSSECTMVAPAHEAGTVEVTAIVNKVKSLLNPSGDRFIYS